MFDTLYMIIRFIWGATRNVLTNMKKRKWRIVLRRLWHKQAPSQDWISSQKIKAESLKRPEMQAARSGELQLHPSVIFGNCTTHSIISSCWCNWRRRLMAWISMPTFSKMWPWKNRALNQKMLMIFSKDMKMSMGFIFEYYVCTSAVIKPLITACISLR